MKKNKIALLVVFLLIATLAKAQNGSSSNSFPPIQKYLDKIKFADNYTEPTKVSQTLTATTYVVTLESVDMKWKETYSGIDWSDFSQYRYNEFKDYFVVEFYFYDDIAYKMDDDEFGVTNEEVDSFKCKFLPEDKDKVLAVLKTWEENLED
jgi:hypothetical protein